MAVKGMGGQLTRNAGPQAKRSSLVAAIQRTSEHEQMVVPLSELAENPANPEARGSADLAELAASISEVGIVQALTVVPAADWVERHPDHKEAVGEARYVVMAGHRRRAAAILAGQSEAPVMIRPDLASVGVTDVQLHENLHRLALTPLQEARAYAAKVAEGHSQRQIAAAVKVSQGQVAKRLSLLQLPDEVQQAVDQGWYSVADALDLLKLDAEVIAEVALRVGELTDPAFLHENEVMEADSDLSRTEALANRARTMALSGSHRLSALTANAARTVATRRRRGVAEARASELGAEFIENPSEKFKNNAWDHALTAARDIERHAKKGNLAVAPGTGPDDTPRYYAVAKDNHKDAQVDAAAAERAATERRVRKGRSDGRKARVAALVQMLAKKPSAGELRDHLVAHVLTAPIYDSQAKTLARKMAIEVGIGPDSTEGYYDWMVAVDSEADPGRREHLAWLLVWAAREQQHQYSSNYSSAWDEGSLAYYADLQQLAGYQPSEWEQEQLAAAQQRAEERQQPAPEDDDTGEMEANQ